MQISPASMQAGWGRSFALKCWRHKKCKTHKGMLLLASGGQESVGGRSVPSAAAPTPGGVGCN